MLTILSAIPPANENVNAATQHTSSAPFPYGLLLAPLKEDMYPYRSAADDTSHPTCYRTLNIPVCCVSFRGRVSGVADHFAQDDEHAISITRSIIANLNLGTVGNAAGTAPAAAAAGGGNDELAPVPPRQWDEPLFDAKEMGSIIPADPKKPFDVRKVS